MFRPVCPAAELWSGDLCAAKLDGVPVVVLRVGDGVHAYQDRCAHLGAPLSGGTLEGSVLTCAAHHWQYDATTGRGINPAHTCLVRLPTRLEAGMICVDPEAP
jgi:toluene monooxygenase system ferredoxin subunit